MSTFFLIVCLFFWLLLGYYSILTVAGILYRVEKRSSPTLPSYPSVSIFIPAYNEGIVLASTLDAMIKLEYPGELTVYVLNDNSQDNSAEIAQFYADLFPRIRHILVPPGTPKGKSRVLNHGLSISQSDYFAVYDADNQPEPAALRLLVETAMTTPHAVGAVGYVKTINEERNILTRMISLEFQVFQLLMQAGRWKLFKTGSLTGTNMLVSRSAIEAVGGYDPHALAEDADLTLTLTAAGGLLPIVPEAVTWEQEPETFAVWLRQRTRWSQGNIYILAKSLHESSWLRGRVLVHILQQFIVYVGFAGLLIASDVWLIMGLTGAIHEQYTAPLLLLWFYSYAVYLLQLISAQTVDNRLSPANMFVAIIMYCTYAQLFLVLLIRGTYSYFLRQHGSSSGPVWDKTDRF
ncbi:glycosyltransferase family 2 protein [Anaerospora sp.]|uniref:glycosyltransferase n=1 Tax=Anaerospora sp. TaxID=1960278 RepID=UPI00289EC1DC|nr:glycosyltransferase family 2 protein [Anaerospora sp.]